MLDYEFHTKKYDSKVHKIAYNKTLRIKYTENMALCGNEMKRKFRSFKTLGKPFKVSLKC